MFRGASLPDEHTTPHEFYLQCTLLLCLFVQQVCKCKSFHVEIIVSNEYLIMKVRTARYLRCSFYFVALVRTRMHWTQSCTSSRWTAKTLARFICGWTPLESPPRIPAVLLPRSAAVKLMLPRTLRNPPGGGVLLLECKAWTVSLVHAKGEDAWDGETGHLPNGKPRHSRIKS